MGIAIADVDRLCMRNLGHGALSKILVKGNNGTVICSGIGGVYRISVTRAEESGGMWRIV